MTSLLLASGGIDSTAIATIYRPEAAVFVDYGQRPAAGERRAVRDVCSHLDLPLHEISIDLQAIGAGLLSTSDRQLAVASSPEWFPYRNQFLVTIAAGLALQLGLEEIWIGLVAEDADRHADGSVQFVTTLNELLRLQEGTIALRAPAHQTSSSSLLARAALPEWLLDRTISCHVASVACGECPGCKKRLEARRRR